MRLIDADEFDVISLKNTSLEFDAGVLYALNMLDKAPTVEDAVVVVRCKDCLHNPNFKTLKKGKVWCRIFRSMVDTTNFCGYGERKSDNE